MKTTNRKDWNFGFQKDTLACVALLVATLTILISGAISVRHQNTLQLQQAQCATQRA